MKTDFYKTKSTIFLFIAYIVPVFLMVSLSFLSFVAVRTQREIHKNLVEKIYNITEKEHDIVAQPLWNVNVKRTVQILNSIMTDPDVAGIAVFDEKQYSFCSTGNLQTLSYKQIKELFAYNSHDFEHEGTFRHLARSIFGTKTVDHENHINREKEIFFLTDAGEEFAGTLFVTVTSDNLDQWFRKRFLNDLLWMALLLLSVIIVVIVAYWRTTLVALHKLLGGIHTAKDNKFIEITGYDGDSELDIVIQAFNEFGERRQEYQQHLEGEKSRLEINVRQRTRDLRESQEKYKNLVESTSDWIWQTNRNGDFIYNSPQSLEITGYSPDELLGKSYFELMTHDDRERLADIFTSRQIFEGPVVKTNKHKNGSLVVLETSIMAIFDDKGHFQGYRGIDRDITERRRFEALHRTQRDLGMALGLADTLASALDICLEAVLTLSYFDCGAFYLVDPQKGSVDLVAHKNLQDDFILEVAHFDADTPNTKLIMKGVPVYKNYPALQDDMELNKEQRGKRNKYGYKAVAVIPILHKGCVIAAMNIASTTTDLISKFDKYALETIASQVSSRLAKIEIEQALTESRINFRTLFNNLNDFLFVLDESGNIIECNKQVEDRLGYAKKELVKLHVLDLHPTPRRNEAADIVKQMLEGKATACSVPLQTKHGELILVETKVTLGTWNNKNAIFGISRDITELKKSEEQIRKNLKDKEALLREIHHRVKNNMQVVSSLMSIQADEISDPKMLAIFSEAETRVQSMAFVHELLYQSENLSEISCQAYFENLVDHLLQVYSSEIKIGVINIEAKNILLRPEQVIPCGMIITELVTNSLKYAVPKKGPTLIINIQAGYDLSGNIFMKIADNGNSNHQPFDMEHLRTLGLQLVTELITGQLEGTYEVTEVDGVCWNICWPSLQPNHWKE